MTPQHEIHREYARVARMMAEARRVSPPPKSEGHAMLGRRSKPANYPHRIGVAQ